MERKHLFVLSALLLLFAPLGLAQAPQVLDFQGKLAYANGTLMNGTTSLTFKIYNVQTGGAALWTEAQSVNVQNGAFDAILGGTTSLSTVQMNQPLFLELVVGAETLSPRMNFTQAPYSMSVGGVGNANSTRLGVGTTQPTALLQVGTYPLTDFGGITGLGVIQQSPQTVGLSLRRPAWQGKPILQLCNNVNLTGNCNYIALDNASGNLLLGTDGNGNTPGITVQQSNNFVGIGKSNPGTPLDVNGGITSTGLTVNYPGADQVAYFRDNLADGKAYIEIAAQSGSGRFGVYGNYPAIFDNAANPWFVLDTNNAAAWLYNSVGGIPIEFDIGTTAKQGGSTKLYVVGDIRATGTKSFVEAYNDTHNVVYAAVESGPVEIYYGTNGTLVNGVATIQLPVHFQFEASKLKPLRVALTPTSDCQMYVGSKTYQSVEVRGHGCSGTFDITVFAVRHGYEDKPVFQKKG